MSIIIDEQNNVSENYINAILSACETIDEALGNIDDDPGCDEQLGEISHLTHAIRKTITAYGVKHQFSNQ